MSYAQIAQLELLNALKSITSEAELNEFKDLVAHFFAAKAQKEIDALWDKGIINEDTINQWGQRTWRNPLHLSAAPPQTPQKARKFAYPHQGQSEH